jgi:hypothetical protein
VLIDETHRKWISASLFILLVATVTYIPYHLYWPNGPSGGSWPGLVYGTVGYAFMLYAGGLMGRKKRPIWRIGRAQTWMRGHLWLGLLSLPVILFHAGFQIGGVLTWTLMTLFVLVWLSGIFGAVVQHFIPRLMTVEVPMETIYEQIETVRAKLKSEAQEIVEAMCGTVAESKKAVAVAAGPSLTGTVMMMAPVGSAGAPVREVEEEAAVRLREFFDNEVAPFLDAPDVGGSQFAERKRADAVFRQIRTLLPASFHDAIDDLEDICEEERELNRQARLHHWMHAWLLAHIPLSLALLLLSAVHAVMALAY